MTDLPLEVQLWNARTVAAYLGEHYDTYMKRTRYQPGFPQALPAFEGKHPRWSAKAVVDWALTANSR